MSAEAVIQVDPALTVKAVAELLGVSKTQFFRLRSAGRFPAPDLKIESLKKDGEARPRWYASTVREWLRSREVREAPGT